MPSDNILALFIRNCNWRGMDRVWDQWYLLCFFLFTYSLKVVDNSMVFMSSHVHCLL